MGEKSKRVEVNVFLKSCMGVGNIQLGSGEKISKKQLAKALLVKNDSVVTFSKKILPLVVLLLVDLEIS